MLSTAEAHALVEQHLGDTARAAHTRVVACLMRKLAEHFSEDGELWEVVGLCHDLDYFTTADDRTQHGILAVCWLGDQLSDVARLAIAAHDHRTGVEADTLLADMLRVADAAAVIDERLGRDVWRESDGPDAYANLHVRLGERAYLGDILQRHASKRALPFAHIAGFFAGAPQQQNSGRGL
jgi:hypothetical protein